MSGAPEEFGLHPKATREPLQGFNERRNKYHKWASETTKPQMRIVYLGRKNNPRDRTTQSQRLSVPSGFPGGLGGEPRAAGEGSTGKAPGTAAGGWPERPVIPGL